NPWLGLVREIADQEGFFHWELDFAHIFTRGGFDLQIGNPPWVRLDWEDDTTLAEQEPFFKLTENIPASIFQQRRSMVLNEGKARIFFLADLASWSGLTEYLGSPIEHPDLAGLRTNLYVNFMERTWRSMSPTSIAGLLHPEGHFSDARGERIRIQA